VLWLFLGAELAWRTWRVEGARKLGRLTGAVLGVG
jgi:hypothetical protein